MQNPACFVNDGFLSWKISYLTNCLTSRNPWKNLSSKISFFDSFNCLPSTCKLHSVDNLILSIDPAWRVQVHNRGAPAAGAECPGHWGLAGHHADQYIPRHRIQCKRTLLLTVHSWTCILTTGKKYEEGIRYNLR